MAVLTRQQVYNYLKNAGATADEAVTLTAIAQLESGFNTTVKNPNSSATGLYQFLRMHWGGSWDPTDPVVATRKALQLFRGSGGIKQLGTGGAGHWEALTLASDGNRTWQRRWNEAVDAAYKTSFATGDEPSVQGVTALSGLTSEYSGEVAEQATAATAAPPEGAEVVSVAGKTYFAYELGQHPATVTLFYENITGTVPGGPVTEMTETEFQEHIAKEQWIDAGTTAAFEDLDLDGESYQDRFNSVLWEMGLMGTDAIHDPEVMQVIGLMLSRPDMSPEEFQNRLGQTAWADSLTDKQKSWNDKSSAQQDLEIMENAAAIAGIWFEWVGEALDFSSYADAAALRSGAPEVYDYAMKLASGEISQRELVEIYIKPSALEVEESPWLRRIRNEEKAKGEHGVSIEEQAKVVQDLYYQFGLPITVAEAKEIGEKLVMNQMSMMDVRESVRDQAEALYPNKPREVATRTWAQPYMSTMSNLWEVGPEVDLADPTIQKALSNGDSLGDFRKALKKDERWLTTNNAQDETHGIISELGKRMGY